MPMTCPKPECQGEIMEITGYFWTADFASRTLRATIYVCESCGALLGGRISPEEIKTLKKLKEKDSVLERTKTLKPVFGVNP